LGVARLEPRSNSASAGARPGGIEAPLTIPSSLGEIEVGIVLGVARLEPRSNSASAGARPGGIEAPLTIPSSLWGDRGGDSFGSRSVRGMLRIWFARIRVGNSRGGKSFWR